MGGMSGNAVRVALLGCGTVGSEVVRLLHGAGFEAVELFGADGTSPYEIGSGKMIAVAS